MCHPYIESASTLSDMSDLCLPYAKMSRRNYVAQTRACSKLVLGDKN